MKGLLISLATSLLYSLTVIVGAQLYRPKRHVWLFYGTIAVLIPVYFVLYAITPRDLRFLSAGWICPNQGLDMAYGFVVFLLNCHNFACVIVPLCSGFSVSLLVAIQQSKGETATTDELLAKFKMTDGTDRIYGWRVPHLERRGYIRIDPQTGNCWLTPKGRWIARVTYVLKRLMNLGAGG